MGAHAEEFEGISRLIEYMKNFENEMRDIRQRLEQIERNIAISKYQKDEPLKTAEKLSKIESVAKDLTIAIESSKIEKTRLLKLLAVPDVPKKLIEVQSILDELELKPRAR